MPGCVPESKAGLPQGVWIYTSIPVAGMNSSLFPSKKWIFVSNTSGAKPVVSG